MTRDGSGLRSKRMAAPVAVRDIDADGGGAFECAAGGVECATDDGASVVWTVRDDASVGESRWPRARGGVVVEVILPSATLTLRVPLEVAMVREGWGLRWIEAGCRWRRAHAACGRRASGVGQGRLEVGVGARALCNGRVSWSVESLWALKWRNKETSLAK